MDKYTLEAAAYDFILEKVCPQNGVQNVSAIGDVFMDYGNTTCNKCNLRRVRDKNQLSGKCRHIFDAFIAGAEFVEELNDFMRKKF
ncbi:MAG: hypothetical protein LBM67_08360 [Lentimicrobiaceae bacterium]|jgi:hypothetical protein|nr:hypothetical protein [Lentimicrobiaceae bacterium]